MYRAAQEAKLASLRCQFAFRYGIARPNYGFGDFSFCTGKQPQIPRLAFDFESLRLAKPILLSGQIRIAGKLWRWKPTAEVWRRAPDTGRLWPVRFFGNINYREGNEVGDIRQLWEPSRLQHLVDLALIAQLGDDDEREKAVQLVKTQAVSWVESNPPLAGPHYISAMECALRMIALIHALDIVRGDLVDKSPWKALTCIVASHAPLIEQRLSLHSSFGNHTVAESAGLVYAGLLFPEMKRSQVWLDKGTSILAEAARTQVLPDGGGAEQALHYHLFNVQLLTLVDALIKHHGRPTPMEIEDAVNRGKRFIGAMAFERELLPPIGDDDDGHALSRFLQLTMCSDKLTQTTLTFPESGYTVAHIGSTASVRMVFDHGPLGMAPAHGHGHADALSLVLSSNGADVLIDPGTYTYTGDQEWRRYFRSTCAHNTVTVDGKDQARQSGCFLWSKPFHARLLASEFHESSGGRLVAEHDGYLEVGVRHVRGIAWLHDQWLIVWDGLSGDGVHDLELHWHVAMPPVWHDKENFEVKLPSGAMTFRCQGGTISESFGACGPLSGWRSPSYGTIEPITTVRLHHRGNLPHDFTTLIRLPGSQPPGNATGEALQWINDRAR